MSRYDFCQSTGLTHVLSAPLVAMIVIVQSSFLKLLLPIYLYPRMLTNAIVRPSKVVGCWKIVPLGDSVHL